MKIIFLDVDGVLNDRNTKHTTRGALGIDIDDTKIQYLKNIVDATSAQIVLCSGWKLGWNPNIENQDISAQYLINKLSKYGLTIMDRTYDPDGFSNRGAGIKNWLVAHPTVETWVVLDDEIFIDYEEQGIIPHLIKSSFYDKGLTEELAEQAIKILKGGLKTWPNG